MLDAKKSFPGKTEPIDVDSLPADPDSNSRLPERNGGKSGGWSSLPSNPTQELTLRYMCENNTTKLGVSCEDNFSLDGVDKSRLKGKQTVPDDLLDGNSQRRCVERDFLQLGHAGASNDNNKSNSVEKRSLSNEGHFDFVSEKRTKVDETLNLSLDTPNLSLSLNSSNPSPPRLSGASAMRRSLSNNTFNTQATSGDFAMSRSQSYSHPFSHNPSCSLTHNSTSNNEYSRETDHIWYAGGGEGTNGSVHTRKGMDATAAAASASASFVGSCSSKTPVVSQGLFLKSSRVFLPGRQRKSVAFSTGWLKSESHLKKGLLRGHGYGGVNLRSTAIKAAASNSFPTDPTDSSTLSIAPLQLESPVGQFLSQILANNPHLLPAAVEKQLEQLEIDLEKEKKNKEDPAIPSTELVLYRRIAELKANERKRTLEEILYALVVQKFMEAEVGLIPAITLRPDPSSSQSSVDVWPAGEVDKLKAMHSSEAYEMIENHLHLILGQRLVDSNSIAPPISKLRVGQVYAASVMYGYFLKRVDQRFQLEKNMKSLPSSKSDEEGVPQLSAGGGTTSPGGFGFGMKPTPLRAYVMSFDSETLQSYASIRSKEAFSIIEKHTEALFGKPDSVTIDASGNRSNKDELMKISIAGLKRLVLEAVTFGSFLWDVESHVDSRYRFVSVST